MTNESKVATSLKLWARTNNILLFRLNVGILYTKWGKQIGSSYGLPDFFAIMAHSTFLGIEVKATAKSTFTPNQKKMFAEIIEKGGKIIVCHNNNLSQVKQFIKGAVNNKWDDDLYQLLCYKLPKCFTWSNGKDELVCGK